MVVYVPPKWRHLMPAAPGREITTPVSFIDLAPTLLALAGAPQPAQMRGRPFLGPAATPQRFAFGMRNRMDERIDCVRTVTDGRWRYIRNYMPHRPWGMHGAYEWQAKGYQDWEAAWRAGTLDPVQARFFGPKPFEELYDLSADPDQVHDLAASRPAERRRLSQALDAHMLDIHDNGLIPEGDPAEGWAASRAPGVYPLPALMRLAADAASRDPSKLPRLAAALSGGNAIARYWGATGLLILGDQARKAQEALGRAAASDASAAVRVVASEAIAGLGDGEGVRFLGALAAPPFPWQTRLAALNALTALGEAARPVLPAIDAAANSDQEYLRNAGRYLSAVLRGEYRPDYRVFVKPAAPASVTAARAPGR